MTSGQRIMLDERNHHRHDEGTVKEEVGLHDRTHRRSAHFVCERRGEQRARRTDTEHEGDACRPEPSAEVPERAVQNDGDPEHDKDAIDDDAACTSEHHGQGLASYGNIAFDIAVVLDTNLTPELIEEGMVREIISKLQTMRKEADFEVTDRIHVTYSGSDKVGEIFEKYGENIKTVVLADTVTEGTTDGYQKEWKINGETVLLGVQKAQ